jgi:hypothetical protein
MGEGKWEGGRQLLYPERWGGGRMAGAGNIGYPAGIVSIRYNTVNNCKTFYAF